MIRIHHLNNSRSQRILWLMEELDLPYEIVKHQRDAETNLAPPSLLAVHPLGKAPVMVDGDITIAESGAIVDYVIRTYGLGRLMPDDSPIALARYHEWLHYAEGSAMLPLMLHLYVGRLGEAGAPLRPRIDGEIDNHLSYLDAALEGRDYFMGRELTGCDIQLSFVVEAANAFGRLGERANLRAFLARIKARPAYRKAIEKGGAYAF
jgi:glutathione S-transferase